MTPSVRSCEKIEKPGPDTFFAPRNRLKIRNCPARKGLSVPDSLIFSRLLSLSRGRLGWLLVVGCWLKPCTAAYLQRAHQSPRGFNQQPTTWQNRSRGGLPLCGARSKTYFSSGYSGLPDNPKRERGAVFARTPSP